MSQLKILLLSILVIITISIIFLVSQNTTKRQIDNDNLEVSNNVKSPTASNMKKEEKIAEENDDQSVEQALKDADEAIKETEKELMEEANEEKELAELLHGDSEEITLTNLWKINEKSNKELIEAFKLPKNLQQIQGVTMKLNELDRVLVGDKIKLPNINGTDYTAIVNNVQQLKSSDLSIQANIVAYGSNYSLRITRGQTITFANITTPRGNYQLQIKPNGEGVVIPENELDKLIDINKPDTIIPPTHKNFKENNTLDSQP